MKTHFFTTCLLLPRTDESKRYLIELCNLYAEAVAKIDEVSDEYDHLRILSVEQQNELDLSTKKCAEIAEQIVICKFEY